jgi:hypothetical protein
MLERLLNPEMLSDVTPMHMGWSIVSFDAFMLLVKHWWACPALSRLLVCCCVLCRCNHMGGENQRYWGRRFLAGWLQIYLQNLSNRVGTCVSSIRLASSSIMINC